MNSRLKVIPYKWNDHTCYIGVINYKDVSSLVDIRSDISMNRKIDDKRVEEIKKYILSDIPATFFPPTILNSRATLSFEEPGALNVKSGNFTVIDGQHRIKAVITLLEEVEGVEKEQLKLMELPVVILEGLENYQHRDLFYMINETPKNVESNVSERFAPKLENLLGLKFFAANKTLVDAIEWHEKQSREKIVYLHMTDCIRELNRILYPTLKDWFDCDRDLLYREPSYVGIINQYWNMYFNKLKDLNNKSFYRKKITLRAIVEEIYLRIDSAFNEERYYPTKLEDAIDKINKIINETLEHLLKEPLIDYQGTEAVKRDVFTSIRHYLKINSKLHEYEEKILGNSNIKILLEKFANTFYLNNLLCLEETDYQAFDSMIVDVISNINTINKIGKGELETILVSAQTTIDDIFEQFAVKGERSL
ncbi:MAG: DNA sulfur modification protein DndB [Bacillota bacterium]